jgi:putative nucleotidyltransferase with HDIG domain
MSAIYRVRQFVQAAGALVRREDTDAVHRYLPATAVDLFEAMPRYDRQHALNVLRSLQEGGHCDPDLLAAALLHDAGKTAHPVGALRLWHRVTMVLVRAFWPALLEQLGGEQARGWRQAFFVQQHHAAIGAELARQAGCSLRTVELIRHHEDPSRSAEYPELTALQAADGVN